MIELRVKGTAFRQVMDTYREVSGDAFADRVLAAIPGPGGDALRSGTLLASSWHPIAWYRAMLRTGTDLSGEGLGYAQKIGRRSAERDIGTVHRVIFRMVSVETLVRQIPRLIGLYFDGGRGSLESTSGDGVERGTFRVVFDGFAGFDELVWLDFLGGCESMLAATGKKNCRARMVSGGRAETAVIELSFRP